MQLTTERLEERPRGRTATPLTLAAGHNPRDIPLARLVGRGAGAVLRLIGEVLAEWRCRRQRAATIRELRAWDDRMLKDIGLTRGDITAAVDGRLDRNGRGRPAPTRGTSCGAPHGQQEVGFVSRRERQQEQA